jgi:hypothetical protein
MRPILAVLLKFREEARIETRCGVRDRGAIKEDVLVGELRRLAGAEVRELLLLLIMPLLFHDGPANRMSGPVVATRRARDVRRNMM